MTNAEKYLKDGVSEYDFLNFVFGEGKIHTGWDGKEGYRYIKKEDLLQLLQQPAEPKLTEDERVILRNIDPKYEFIGRDDENFLYIRLSADNGKIVERLFGLDSAFPSLFKFIKNGEEYLIEELLKGE